LAGHTKMAQTNFTPISLYYSATTTNVPTAGNLVAGELAINTADGKLFYKDSAGVVQTIASKAGNSGSFTNLAYTGTLTGGTGIVNLGSGQFYKDASGNVGIGTASPSGKFHVNAGGTYQNLIFKSESANTSTMRLAIDGDGPYIYQSAATSEFRFASQFASSFLTFYTGSGGERMRIDSSGRVLVAATTGQGDGKLYSKAVNGSYAALSLEGDVTAGQYVATFYNANGFVGSIVTNGSSTAFNTSSDYRLKENIAPMQNALNVVQQLKPVTYKWKVDGSSSQGFIAHELAEIVPECVTGEKNAVDAEGKPVYQGIDTSFLVATLTAAIQELNAKVDSQAVEISTLKAK